MVHPRLFVNDFSIIVPVLGHDKLVMVWNYRHAIQGWELELPAGHIENGESPEACARRELEEETGYSAGSWKRLGWFHPSPGISSQKAYAYLARKLKRGVLHREQYEFGMEVKTLGLRDAYRTTGCLQAVVAWRDCPLADRVGFGYSATRDPENEESYCFAPQLVQNEFPRASGTPQERHFAVAVATAGACTGAEGEGLYWRVACAAGAY